MFNHQVMGSGPSLRKGTLEGTQGSWGCSQLALFSAASTSRPQEEKCLKASKNFPLLHPQAGLAQAAMETEGFRRNQGSEPHTFRQLLFLLLQLQPVLHPWTIPTPGALQHPQRWRALST